MKKLIFKAAILTLAGIMFVGCGKNTEPNDPKKENKVDLVLSIEPNEVYEGQTLAYKITTKDAPTENITITLSSDNTSVATVDPTVIMPKGIKETSGVIKGILEGSAKIKIEAGENKISVAEQTVTVKKIPPKTVALSISAVATEINAEETTEFTVTTPNAPEEDLQITVTSSDPLIASVASPLTLKAGEKQIKGEINGVAEGNATITITADKAEIIKGNLEIKVNRKKILELSVNTNTPTVVIGSNIILSISSPVPADRDITVRLENSNPAVATLTHGSVTLSNMSTSVLTSIKTVGIGTTTITISSDDVDIYKPTQEITVVVVPAKTSRITCNKQGSPSMSDQFFLFTATINNVGQYPGGLFVHDMTWDYTPSTPRTTLETYWGDIVGEILDDGVYIVKPVAKGTLIDDNLDWLPIPVNLDNHPFIASDEHTIGNGEHYLVFKGNINNGSGPKYRCWIKVKVQGTSVELLEGALAEDNEEFVVGRY